MRLASLTLIKGNLFFRFGVSFLTGVSMNTIPRLILPIITASLLSIALPAHAETPTTDKSSITTDNPFAYSVNDQWDKIGKQVVQYRQAGNYTKAIESAKKGIELVKKVKGKNHPATALSYQALGLSYIGAGDYNKSNEAFIMASNIINTLAKRPDYAKYQNEIRDFLSFDNYYLAANYQQLKDKDNFEKAMLRLIELNEFRLGKADRHYLAWTNTLSIYYIQTGKVDKAIDFQKSIIAKLEKMSKQPTQELAIAYQFLGFIYRDSGQHQQALTTFKKLLQITEQLDGKEHLNTVSGYINVAVSYLALKNTKQAKTYLNKAKKTVDKLEKALKKDNTSSDKVKQAKQANIDFINKAIEHYLSSIK